MRILESSGRRLGYTGNFGELLWASKGQYVAFADQDDVWLPEKLELAMREMHRVEEACAPGTPVMVHSDLVVVNERLEVICGSLWRYQRVVPTSNGRWRPLLVQNCVHGCTALLNSAARSLAVPVPACARGHDWWSALLCAIAGKLVAVTAQTVLYRQHGRNASGAWRYGWIAAAGKLRTARKSLQGAKEQALAAAARLRGRVEPEEVRVLETFGRLGELGFLSRRKYLLRHGILPAGALRKLGLLLLV